MKLDKNAIYPHPIWGWTEDFIGEEPKVNLEITINDLDQEIVIRLSMENSNEDIEKLITRVRDKNFMIFNQAKDIEYWAAFQGRLIYLYSLVLLIPEDKLPV